MTKACTARNCAGRLGRLDDTRLDGNRPVEDS